MLKGMKVKIAMVMRGREMIHKDLAQQLIIKIRADLSHIGLADAGGSFPDYLLQQAETAGDAPGCSPFAAIRERGADQEPHDPVDREALTK